MNLFLLASLLATVTFAVTTAAQSVPQVNPVPVTPESIAAGEKMYQRHCRVCHGKTGTGGMRLEEGPAASNLVDEKWDHGGTDSAIFYAIKKGVPPEMVMAPFEEQLSDADIWNVVNYIRSLAPKK